jgi:hypothetical protein
MYLNYYRKNEMQPDDNPPVGILMCTEVGAETVEYAAADGRVVLDYKAKRQSAYK